MCIIENLYNTIEKQEIRTAIHSYFTSTESIEHFKSLEHIEAYIWLLAECISLLIPLGILTIIIYYNYKFVKSVINNNKCKNKYTDCNTCNKCEYKEDCKNGF